MQSNGPKIVTNGLVFAFDTSNRNKSFKGRKNLAKTATGAIDWSVGNLTTSGISRTTIVNNEKYQITCTTGGSFRIYFNSANLRNGVYYNLSFKFIYKNAANTNFNLTDWCDQAITQTVELLSDGVYKVSAYGVRSTYDSTYRFMDAYIESGSIIEIWDLQLEEGTKSSKYETALLSSSNGQLTDWTGNHSINLNSINFDTLGNIQFTAQSHNISVDSNGFTLPGQKTLSIWIKSDRPLSTADNWEVGFLNQGSTVGSMFGWMYGVGNCQDLGFWGYGSSYDMSVEAVNNKWSSDGNWHNGVLTMDSSRNVRGYVDGVPIQWLRHTDYTTKVDFVTLPIDTTNYFLINSRAAWNSGMSYVDLGNVMVYNRALTSAEVKQNFNALKGRYGL